MAFSRLPATVASLTALALTSPALADAPLGEASAQQQIQGEQVQRNGTNRQPRPDGLQDNPIPVRSLEKPVFDETWATIGIGAGLVPSYTGSDDFRVFPLPLIVGRVGGIGISPNGPGFNLDLLSEGPPSGPPGRASSKPSFSFGPSFRFRNDRANQVEDEVVELAEPLDTAFEIGASAGVSFPGVLRPGDRLGVSTQVRWDILGAHDGMLIEPSVSYFTPVGRGGSIQFSANASFVDDSYADYYYSVTPAQSADTGLAEFSADGGLDSVGLVAIGTVDLDGNALNGGFSIYAIGGYSRLVGDGADTPFTADRGSANQFLVGLGVGYTF